jgi:hypothetical protein
LPALAAVAGSRASTPVSAAVRTDRVLRRRDRHDAGAARQPDRRLDAGDARLAGGADDGAVGLGAERDRGERGRDRGRRPRAGTAGVTVEHPRIAALAAHAAPAARAAEAAEIRPFAEIGLAQDDCPGAPQAARDRRVLQRGPPGECERARTRAETVGGVDVVLEQDRNAVQRTARPFAAALRVEPAGNGLRVRVQLEDAREVEPLVDAPDAPQVDVHELARGQAARLHHPLQPRDRGAGDLEVDVEMRLQDRRILGGGLAGACRGERGDCRAAACEGAGLEERSSADAFRNSRPDR